jgi:hypothetical protein
MSLGTFLWVLALNHDDLNCVWSLSYSLDLLPLSKECPLVSLARSQGGPPRLICFLPITSRPTATASVLARLPQNISPNTRPYLDSSFVCIDNNLFNLLSGRVN